MESMEVTVSAYASPLFLSLWRLNSALLEGKESGKHVCVPVLFVQTGSSTDIQQKEEIRENPHRMRDRRRDWRDNLK